MFSRPMDLSNMPIEQLLELSDICSVANDILKVRRSNIWWAAFNKIETHLRTKQSDLMEDYYIKYKQCPPEFEKLTYYSDLQEKIFKVIEERYLNQEDDLL